METLSAIPDLSGYDSEIKAVTADLIKRLESIDTEPIEVLNLHARKDICRTAQDLAAEHSELVTPFIPCFVNILREEVDRTFDSTAGEIVKRDTSVAIQRYATQTIAECADRSLVQSYIEATVPIESYLMVLAQTVRHGRSRSARINALRGIAGASAFVTEDLISCTSKKQLVSAIGSLQTHLESGEDLKLALRVLTVYISQSPYLRENIVEDLKKTQATVTDARCLLYIELLTKCPVLEEDALSVIEWFRRSESPFFDTLVEYSGIRYWRAVEELGIVLALYPKQNGRFPDLLIDAASDPAQHNLAMIRQALGELAWQYHRGKPESKIIDHIVQRFLSATHRERRTTARVLGILMAYIEVSCPTSGTGLQQEIRTEKGMPKLRAAETLGTLVVFENTETDTRTALAQEFIDSEGRNRRRYARAFGEWVAANGDPSSVVAQTIADRLPTTSGTHRDVTARAMTVASVLENDSQEGSLIQRLQKSKHNTLVSTAEVAITLGIVHIEEMDGKSVSITLLEQARSSRRLSHEIAIRAVGEFALATRDQVDQPLTALATVIRRSDGLERTQAARAFGFAFTTLSRDIGVAVPDLVSMVQSTVPRQRACAAHALGLVTALPMASLPASLSSLIERIYDPDEHARWDLARLIGYCVISRPDAFTDIPDDLLADFHGATGHSRRQIAVAIGILVGAIRDPPHTPLDFLTKVVRTQSGSERRNAAMAVGMIVAFENDHSSDELAALFKRVRSSETSNRLEAARALGELHSFSHETATESLDAIISDIRTGAGHERYEAAYLLGISVASAPDIVDHVSKKLVEQLGSTTHISRGQDRRALGMVAGATDRSDAIARIQHELESDLSHDAVVSYGQALKHLVTELANIRSVQNVLLSTDTGPPGSIKQWLSMNDPARRIVLEGVANMLPVHLSEVTVTDIRRQVQQTLTCHEPLPTETRLVIIRILSKLGGRSSVA